MSPAPDDRRTTSDVSTHSRRHPGRESLLWPAIALTALVGAACTGTGSYKNQTEDFINADSTIVALAGADVSQATCDEPASAEVGTEYTCTAEVEGVGSGTFDVEINAEDSFLVTDFNPV